MMVMQAPFRFPSPRFHLGACHQDQFRREPHLQGSTRRPRIRSTFWHQRSLDLRPPCSNVDDSVHHGCAPPSVSPSSTSTSSALSSPPLDGGRLPYDFSGYPGEVSNTDWTSSSSWAACLVPGNRLANGTRPATQSRAPTSASPPRMLTATSSLPPSTSTMASPPPSLVGHSEGTRGPSTSVLSQAPQSLYHLPFDGSCPPRRRTLRPPLQVHHQYPQALRSRHSVVFSSLYADGGSSFDGHLASLRQTHPLPVGGRLPYIRRHSGSGGSRGAVRAAAQKVISPTEQDRTAVTRNFLYLSNTIDYGIKYSRDASIDLRLLGRIVGRQTRNPSFRRRLRPPHRQRRRLREEQATSSLRYLY
jgi:hypothetical protein